MVQQFSWKRFSIDQPPSQAESLHWACWNRQPAAVRTALAAGADPNSRSSTGSPPLLRPRTCPKTWRSASWFVFDPSNFTLAMILPHASPTYVICAAANSHCTASSLAERHSHATACGTNAWTGGLSRATTLLTARLLCPPSSHIWARPDASPH